MATHTTKTSDYAWSPDFIASAASDAIPEALVLQTSTVAGVVEGDAPSVRVPFVDDAAAGFVSEGATIDEAAPDLSEVIVYTGKIAQLIRLSREQFNSGGASQILATSVRRAVTTAANAAYVNQAAPESPAVTPPAGLLNVTGIVEGDDIDGDLDALADGLATVEGNGGTVTHLIAAPDALGFLRKFKLGTDSNASLLGAGSSDMQRALLGVPMLVSSAMPSGKLLAVDRNAVVSAVGAVQVQQSEHVYFASDSIGLRCTFRFGQNVVHANRIAEFSIVDPDAE